ncbi:MAG: retropepsin-like domain-containing protein [Planctomycetes bacterium]|nr:retropepsin-like domain-containing protein [Planctomycetota bacterium]
MRAQDEQDDQGQGGWEPRDPLVELVESCRSALTGEVGAFVPTSVFFKGEGSVWGAPSTATLLYRPPGGFLLEFQGSLPLKFALFPHIGQTVEGGWEIDAMGAPWKSDLSDLERRRWLFSVMSGEWLDDPDVKITMLDEPEDAEFRGVTLTRPGAIFDVKLELNRTSFLPMRLTLVDGALATVTEFSKWTERPGHLWPMRVVIDGASSGTVFEITGFSPPPQYLVDPLQLRATFTDTTFDANAPKALECRRSKSGHLLVHPRVDGKDVGWFVFDSGASSFVLDRKARAKLGLEKVGQRTAHGAGREIEAPVVRATTLALGPMTIAKPLFLELDLANISAGLGEELAGLVGADVLRRAVVVIDRETPSLELHAPTGFELAGATWTPLRFDRRLACVEARFEGDRHGLFRLDTGAGTSLVIHASAVQALGLLAGREVDEDEGSGVGGDFAIHSGELAWFEFGGVRREHVPTQFCLPGQGNLDSRATIGILGADLLAATRVVFDYGRERIAFVPRSK